MLGPAALHRGLSVSATAFADEVEWVYHYAFTAGRRHGNPPICRLITTGIYSSRINSIELLFKLVRFGNAESDEEADDSVDSLSHTVFNKRERRIVEDLL